jgi:hypothetical protein
MKKSKKYELKSKIHIRDRNEPNFFVSSSTEFLKVSSGQQK